MLYEKFRFKLIGQEDISGVNNRFMWREASAIQSAPAARNVSAIDRAGLPAQRGRRLWTMASQPGDEAGRIPLVVGRRGSGWHGIDLQQRGRTAGSRRAASGGRKERNYDARSVEDNHGCRTALTLLACGFSRSSTTYRPRGFQRESPRWI